MTSPADSLTVQQLDEPVKAATDLVVAWGSDDLSPGRLRNMIAELLVQREATYAATVRRQQAALDAVTELADEWEEGMREMGYADGRHDGATSIRLALASPAPTEATT